MSDRWKLPGPSSCLPCPCHRTICRPNNRPPAPRALSSLAPWALFYLHSRLLFTGWPVVSLLLSPSSTRTAISTPLRQLHRPLYQRQSTNSQRPCSPMPSAISTWSRPVRKLMQPGTWYACFVPCKPLSHRVSLVWLPAFISHMPLRDPSIQRNFDQPSEEGPCIKDLSICTFDQPKLLCLLLFLLILALASSTDPGLHLGGISLHS